MPGPRWREAEQKRKHKEEQLGQREDLTHSHIHSHSPHTQHTHTHTSIPTYIPHIQTHIHTYTHHTHIHTTPDTHSHYTLTHLPSAHLSFHCASAPHGAPFLEIPHPTPTQASSHLPSPPAPRPLVWGRCPLLPRQTPAGPSIQTEAGFLVLRFSKEGTAQGREEWGLIPTLSLCLCPPTPRMCLPDVLCPRFSPEGPECPTRTEDTARGESHASQGLRSSTASPPGPQGYCPSSLLTRKSLCLVFPVSVVLAVDDLARRSLLERASQVPSPLPSLPRG